jgi:hypothetical protein
VKSIVKPAEMSELPAAEMSPAIKSAAAMSTTATLGEGRRWKNNQHHYHNQH